MNQRFDLRDPNALSIQVSELLVATADDADASLGPAIPEVLSLLRQRLKMDVVFVSEFIDGQRVFRFVDSAEGAPPVTVGDGGPLEASYCQRVVDGRLPGLVHDLSRHPDADIPTPFPVGAHLSTPVVLPDGSTYGTLCCFSSAANPQLQQRDLVQLRHCAELVARKIDASAQRRLTPDWSLAPVESGRAR